MPKDTFPPGVVVIVHPKGWIDEVLIKVWLDEVFMRRPGGLLNETQKFIGLGYVQGSLL